MTFASTWDQTSVLTVDQQCHLWGWGNTTPFCSICSAMAGVLLTLGTANPSTRLCTCPCDAVKQPDSAGDQHLLLTPAGEKHAAAMPPRQPLQRWEDWKSSCHRMELTNWRELQRLSCPSRSPRLRTHPLAVTQQAPHVGGNEPVFSCY